MIPDFREDGYLPEGLHLATFDEVADRFGTGSHRRAYLLQRLRKWVALAHSTGAKRLLIAGSFVTSKTDPNDIDSVIWLADDFSELVESGAFDANELAQMLKTRNPEEIFAAEDSRDWNDWLQFFCRTRERDSRKQGIVEIQL